MKKILLASVSMVLLAVSGVASAVTLQLVADNTRSSSGTLSTQKWATCAPLGATNPCISTTNAWTLANQTGSTATWAWDGTTLAATGMFQSTSHLSSNANGNAVISDRTVGLNINTGTMTTTATSYNCIEGNFLGNVGANGCLNTSTGGDFTDNSSALYNVGGNANCVQRTVGGDDASTGNPRGLMSVAAGGGCDATDGAYDLWTIVSDNTGIGGQLILSNGIATSAAGTHYMTFNTVVPVPAAVWLFGSALGVLGVARRRRVATA